MQQMDMSEVIQNNLLGEERKRLQGEAFVKIKYCINNFTKGKSGGVNLQTQIICCIEVVH
jgi:hypothetical protein